MCIGNVSSSATMHCSLSRTLMMMTSSGNAGREALVVNAVRNFSMYATGSPSHAIIFTQSTASLKNLLSTILPNKRSSTYSAKAVSTTKLGLDMLRSYKTLKITKNINFSFSFLRDSFTCSNSNV